jgi:FAD/FMN-containing dehydrogenase
LAVVRHWLARAEPQSDFIERLRRELLEAASERRPVVVGAARHSMGGQSLARDATAITLADDPCLPDRAAGTFRAYAGTRWRTVIAALDPLGFSPAVMQSNHDFGVASTFSVNAHGWPVPYGPFGSTVRAIRLMLADGTILTCSPAENEELFRLAMGGYGLFGVILELEAEMVPNALLKARFEAMAAGEFASRFVAAVQDDAVRMAYGRLSVAAQGLMEQALMVTYRPQPASASGLPPAGGAASTITRRVYRAQIGSETAKRVRWIAETVAGPALGSVATRNTLLNEPVSNLADEDDSRTDILHEYFLPPERLTDFTAACRDVFARRDPEFLNVTLRYVAADRSSILAFAPTPRIAAVMSFSQGITPKADEKMLGLTKELIDQVIALGGSFYLPYRLHARRDQVEKAYPNLAQFAARKRHYDPGLLFRNLMWDAYFGG